MRFRQNIEWWARASLITAVAGLSAVSCGKATDGKTADGSLGSRVMAAVARILPGKDLPKNGKPADPPVPIRIGTVTKQEMPVQVPGTGAVEPIRSVQIKAQVSGPVTKVLFKEGDMVQEGQVLFLIDPRPFEVALRQAESNLAKSQAQLEQARASLARDAAQAKNAQAVLERDKMLIEKKMISPEEFDKSQTDAEALRAVVAADEASIKSATESIGASKASIDEAQLQLDYCTIKAPLTGRTGNVMVKEGNLVRANDSTAMVVINQLAPIYVSFAVPEKYLPSIQKYFAEGPVKVSAMAEKATEPTNGVLSFIDNAVQSGTVRLKGTFENADSRLWPGQFVKVILQITVQADAIVAPTRAVQTGQQGAYVYVINGDNKAEMRNVVVGESVDNLTAILEGLAPDEKVVTDGQSRLKTGAEVKIVTDEPAPGAPAA